MTAGRLLRRSGRLVAAMTALAASSSAHGQFAGAASEGPSLWRVLMATIFCLLLAVAGAFALKARLGGGAAWLAASRTDRRLHVVESVRIGPQAQLAIVACDGAELLVAVSPQGAQLLTRLDRAVGDQSAAAPCE